MAADGNTVMNYLGSRFIVEFVQSGDKAVNPLGWRYTDGMTTEGNIAISWPV